jgi:hypothetical protein
VQSLCSEKNIQRLSVLFQFQASVENCVAVLMWLQQDKFSASKLSGYNWSIVFILSTSSFLLHSECWSMSWCLIFKFYSNSQHSIGSNTRRIEAVTGKEAVENFQRATRREERIAKLLETDVEQLETRVLEQNTSHKLCSFNIDYG